MPRRAYILVNETNSVICRVAAYDGNPQLATFSSVEQVQADLRRRYPEHQYTIYAIVPITARVMLEPMPNEPTRVPPPPPSSELLEQMRQDLTSTGRMSSTSGSRQTRPRPEPAPEDIEQQSQEGQDRPEHSSARVQEPSDIPF